VSETVYGLSERDVRRLKDLLNRSERTFRNHPPQRQRWPAPGWSGAIPARATAGFAAGSVSSPSSASVTLYVPSASGAGWTLSTTIVTAYNPYTSAIAANTLLWLMWYGGYLYVIAANC
jgi:hypothetical protein